MMEDPKFAIPQWALDIAIEGLRELALRQEIEAAALAQVNTREAALLADERLEQAAATRKGFEFFLNL